MIFPGPETEKTQNHQMQLNFFFFMTKNALRMHKRNQHLSDPFLFLLKHYIWADLVFGKFKTGKRALRMSSFHFSLFSGFCHHPRFFASLAEPTERVGALKWVNEAGDAWHQE